ncbi:MAG: hypothetical protein ACLSWI_00405 [Candidatus Gastranaerophilaceae bacterium]
MEKTLQKEILKTIELTEEVLRANMETSFETYCEMKARLQFLAYLVLQTDKNN